MLAIAIILMVIGMIGIFIPGIPGNGLIFLSTLLYGIFTKFEEISVIMIVIFGVLTIAAFMLDYISSVMGAKKFGATKAGIIGGILGGFVGLFIFNIIGLLIGQFFGTLIGELYYGKELKLSMKSGVGSLIGYIAGVAINTTIGLTIIVLFLLKVLI
ncbi:DUF456 domain-containing protein [Tepidibacter aestuarii]|uniref:DUF456 domain-containing protein n=1 Tax=Tepidibacter aestuarii TaxID=2925782 RepID=UPI0020C136A6|nr:DUF456 domain-containing protein [Tepidibacter aestuarii]CAH2212042.1 conserved membrane protein of unknown function [Tepidibacter aestuarii]